MNQERNKASGWLPLPDLVAESELAFEGLRLQIDKALAARPESVPTPGVETGLGLPATKALRALCAEARQEAALLNRGKGGSDAGKLLSAWVDRILQELLRFSTGGSSSVPGLALLALGSYGRREMAPFSDWDFLVLFDGGRRELSEEGLRSIVGNLVRPLWDAGLTLGHAVRTRDECLALMEEGVRGEQALETATGLLEARFVTGDLEWATAFLKSDLPAFFKRAGRPFVEAKVNEAMLRHRRQGVSVYHTQPHLKNHPGGLRDFQLALWIDRACQLSGHLPRLAHQPLVSQEDITEASRGYVQLLTFRQAMHILCGRKQDVLDHQMQQKLAEDLGYPTRDDLRPSELLLKDYFQAATAIHRLTDKVIRRYREEQDLAARNIARLRRNPVDKDFIRIGDFLYASREGYGEGPDWLSCALRSFLVAARLGIGLGQEIREAIRRRLPGMTEAERRDPEAAALFRALLGRRTGVAKMLREMRDIGLLGELLPEFGEIQGLVIQDHFHDFTVDEHTLFVLENIDRTFVSGAVADLARREVLEHLAHPELLRLAALVHDLGKSRGGPGHSKRGALMVPLIAERLGLDQSQTRMLIFLVEDHLLLSKTCLRRDVGEGRLLEQLAARIGTREGLDLLYLLTCADIAAVGSGAFPGWKEELLKDIHRRLAALLEAPAGAEPEPLRVEARDLKQRLLGWARSPEDLALCGEHLERVPSRYLVEVSPAEACLHLDLVRRLRAEKKSAVASATPGEGDIVGLWVVSTDRRRRFYRICGALLGFGVNVVSALAYERSDGIILDHFLVGLAPDAPPALSGSAGAELWSRIAQEIERVLAGEGEENFRVRLEAARKRIPREPRVARLVEPSVRLDNRLSERFTVVDVVCGDRVGLLYGLSRAIADIGCEIHFAKVDTNQGLATDVFYITEVGAGQVVDEERAHIIRLLLCAVAADYQSARR